MARNVNVWVCRRCGCVAHGGSSAPVCFAGHRMSFYYAYEE